MQDKLYIAAVGIWVYTRYLYNIIICIMFIILYTYTYIYTTRARGDTEHGKQFSGYTFFEGFDEYALHGRPGMKYY